MGNASTASPSTTRLRTETHHGKDTGSTQAPLSPSVHATDRRRRRLPSSLAGHVAPGQAHADLQRSADRERPGNAALVLPVENEKRKLRDASACGGASNR